MRDSSYRALKRAELSNSHRLAHTHIYCNLLPLEKPVKPVNYRRCEGRERRDCETSAARADLLAARAFVHVPASPPHGDTGAGWSPFPLTRITQTNPMCCLDQKLQRPSVNQSVQISRPLSSQQSETVWQACGWILTSQSGERTVACPVPWREKWVWTDVSLWIKQMNQNSSRLSLTLR